MEAVLFVNGEVSLSVVSVLMKFYTESRNYLTKWCNIERE